MKKITYAIIFTLMLLVTVILASAQVFGTSNETKCKVFGDFVDSKNWDLELEYMTTTPNTLICYDTVEPRQYEVTYGAINYVMSQPRK